MREHRSNGPTLVCGTVPAGGSGSTDSGPLRESLLIAVDYRTGEVIWQSPNPRGWQMTHVSVMPMQWQERRCYLYCGSGGVAAVAADDGSLLWDSTDWPSTLCHLSLSAGAYRRVEFSCAVVTVGTTGSLMLQVQKSGDAWAAQKLFELTPRQVQCRAANADLLREHIFGVRKHGGGQLVCLDLQGKEIWNSGSDRFGHGPFLIADDLILVMDDHGQLTVGRSHDGGL